MVKFYHTKIFSLLILLVLITTRDVHTTPSESPLETRIKSAVQPPRTYQDLTIAHGSAALLENSVPAKEKYQGGRFYVQKRKEAIGRFKCSQCHDGQKGNSPQAKALAHGNIALNHGEKKKPLACDSCHDQDSRDLLVTTQGRKVAMDHSYQLCGQCHFREKKDWIGGAHGKRLLFWAGRRVVANCTYCHDPHSPKFNKRWPRTYSLPKETR